MGCRAEKAKEACAPLWLLFSVLLCSSPNWPRTHYVDHARLQLTETCRLLPLRAEIKGVRQSSCLASRVEKGLSLLAGSEDLAKWGAA